METVIKLINLTEDRNINIWVSCDNGGYKFNRDGQTWKEYLVHIEDNGKNFIEGVITCSPCGIMKNIWSSYYLTLIMWDNRKA